MSKKDKQRQISKGDGGEKSQVSPIISRRGWQWIAAGACIAVLGYIILSFTDPRGQNVASHVSPFLILAGYATIGIGILIKDPQKPHQS